jgi:hypothetical protein
MAHPDPLVTLWRDTSRPLNWRPWQSLSDAEQARLRWLIMDEMCRCDTHHDACPPWWWTHSHHQLLELKAACGHATEVAHVQN